MWLKIEQKIRSMKVEIKKAFNVNNLFNEMTKNFSLCFNGMFFA